MTVENSRNPSSVYIRLCKHRKKVFYCFYKIFLKTNPQMKGNFVYNCLIQKDFLNTRSRQSTFLLTNQNAHLITQEPIKFPIIHIKLRVNESDISFES